MRTVRFAILAGFVAVFGTLGISPAAASDVTITSPTETEIGVGQAAANQVLLEIEGTWGGAGTSSDGGMEFYLLPYIDGNLMTCNDYYGSTPGEDGACYMSVGGDGTGWLASYALSDFERINMEVYGTHTFEFREWVRGEDGVFSVTGGSASITIELTSATGADSSPDSSPDSVEHSDANDTAPVDAEPSGQRSGSQLHSGSAGSPSVISTLPTAAQVVQQLTPQRTLITALVTVILLLIVGFPGQLIGATVQENYERIFGWTKRFTSALAGLPKLSPRVSVAVGIAIATVISAFVDPQFGFNIGSVRLLLSISVAFVIESLLGWLLILRVLRRTDPDLKPVVRFRYGSLVVVVLAVVISRIVGFEPGMVFGLIVGITFGATLAASRQARIVLIGLGYAFALAVIGWALYSALDPIWGGGEGGFLGTFALETLGGVAIGGIAALPIALVPIAALDGGALWAWKKWVWAACYAVGLFVFLVVLLPLPISWGETGLPFITWIVLYALYALGAVGLWLYFRSTQRTRNTGDVESARDPAAQHSPSD